MLRKYLYIAGIIFLGSGLFDIYLWCYGLPTLPPETYLLPSWILGAFIFSSGVTLITTLHIYTKEKKEDAMP